MPFLECTIFGMCLIWNVIKMESALLGMCSNGMCPFWNVLLECALFGMCSERNMIPFWTFYVVVAQSEPLPDKQRWCDGALLFRFWALLIGSEHTEISELLTLNICLTFWTFLVELVYCEPPPDTQRWCDGALLLRVRRRRFLSALLLVLSARARFLYSIAYYDLRLKRSSSGRCWAARAKRLLCYWILEIQVSVFGTSPNMPNMHMSILHTMISINVNDVCKIQW